MENPVTTPLVNDSHVDLTDSCQISSSVLDQWKTSLKCLLNDSLDKFEILGLATKLQYNLPQEKDFRNRNMIYRGFYSFSCEKQMNEM